MLKIKKVFRNISAYSQWPGSYPVWWSYRSDLRKLEAILWSTPEVASKNELLFSSPIRYHQIYSRYNSSFVRLQLNRSVYPRNGPWDGLGEIEKHLSFSIPALSTYTQRLRNSILFQRHSKAKCWVWSALYSCGSHGVYWVAGYRMTFQIFWKAHTPSSIFGVRSLSDLWIVCWVVIIWCGLWWVVGRRFGSYGCRGQD